MALSRTVTLLTILVSVLALPRDLAKLMYLLEKCPPSRRRSPAPLVVGVLTPPTKTNAGMPQCPSNCYNALARFRTLLVLETIRTVQLSMVRACLTLVEKLMRFGALSNARARLGAATTVGLAKTATLCRCLTAPALRNVLLRLIWLSPCMSFAVHSNVLDSAAPFVLIRVRTLTMTCPTGLLCRLSDS